MFWQNSCLQRMSMIFFRLYLSFIQLKIPEHSNKIQINRVTWKLKTKKNHPFSFCIKVHPDCQYSERIHIFCSLIIGTCKKQWIGCANTIKLMCWAFMWPIFRLLLRTPRQVLRSYWIIRLWMVNQLWNWFNFVNQILWLEVIGSTLKIVSKPNRKCIFRSFFLSYRHYVNWGWIVARAAPLYSEKSPGFWIWLSSFRTWIGTKRWAVEFNWFN